VVVQYDIPPLEQDGSNFAVWQFHIRVVLRSYKLLTVLVNPRPHPLTFPAEAAAWDEKDQQAFSLIALSLTGELAHLIFHVQTAKDCLDCLAACFEGRGSHKLSQLMT
jgi:hypothetical protein